MTITALEPTGNSSKFQAITKHGEFNVALSFTLKSKIWKLADADAELAVAKELSEAIVSRHNPELPFKKLYIFAEHNCESTYERTIQRIRREGM